MAGESYQAALRSLTELLNMSEVGVALYDRNLHCRALSSAFAKMTGIPAIEQIGKTFRQVFGETVRKVEAAFDGVCRAARPLLNFELAIQLPATMKRSRWLVNFHPMKGESDCVQLVAAFFFEITTKSSLEQKFTQLVERLIAESSCDPSLGREDFVDLSMRSLERINRSLEMIKSSIALRGYFSETQIESEFLHRKPLIPATAGPRFAPRFGSPLFRGTAGLPRHRGGEPGGKRLTTEPSPRERQVVGLLAEGKSNKEMAAILEISTRTVEAYRARVMAKLKLHSVAELVRYAVRNNLAQP